MVSRLRLLVTRRAGVRARAAATAAAVVALALVTAGVAQVVLLERSLRSAAEATALEQTEHVAARLAPDGPAEAVRELRSALDLVQVLDASGAMVAASAPLVGQTPLSSARPVPGEVVTEEIVSPAIDPDDTLIVAVRGIMTPDGPRTVLAAVPLNGVDNSVRTAEHLLWLGVPALVLVTALATFAATGRALRPVEAIRARVAAMSDRDLDQRVPVPATRDEIGRLAATMNALLARLQGAQSVQRQFVADASHELRSPLATITAGLDLVHSRDDRDAARLTAMREEAQRLDRIIGDLLLLARADERGLLPRSDDVDLDELVYTEQLRLREISTLQIDVDVVADPDLRRPAEAGTDAPQPRRQRPTAQQRPDRYPATTRSRWSNPGGRRRRSRRPGCGPRPDLYPVRAARYSARSRGWRHRAGVGDRCRSGRRARRPGGGPRQSGRGCIVSRAAARSASVRHTVNKHAVTTPRTVAMHPG